MRNALLGPHGWHCLTPHVPSPNHGPDIEAPAPRPRALRERWPWNGPARRSSRHTTAPCLSSRYSRTRQRQTQGITPVQRMQPNGVRLDTVHTPTAWQLRAHAVRSGMGSLSCQNGRAGPIRPRHDPQQPPATDVVRLQWMLDGIDPRLRHLRVFSPQSTRQKLGTDPRQRRSRQWGSRHRGRIPPGVPSPVGGLYAQQQPNGERHHAHHHS